MIKSRDFKDCEFKDKFELFDALKSNKEILISEKKAQVYKSIEKGLSVSVNQIDAVKLLEVNKNINIDENYYYFVVNTSNILDSHLDVHVDGNWEKSVKEQQKKTYLVWDHRLERSEIIAMKESIEMFTAYIPFSLIGKDYTGETYALIYKVHKDNIVNEEAKKWIEKGYSFECSVRMQYMDIDIAMDSNRPEDTKEKGNFDKYFPLIANKDDFKEINYFWIVKQAKNVFESSLVMFGSNSATGLAQANENKSEVTDEFITEEIIQEPEKSTQKDELKELLSKIKV